MASLDSKSTRFFAQVSNIALMAKPTYNLRTLYDLITAAMHTVTCVLDSEELMNLFRFSLTHNER